MPTSSLSNGRVANSQSVCKKPVKLGVTLAYRFAVVARFGAAIVGGYIFTAVFTSLLSLLLPLNRLDSVLVSTTLSIFVYATVFIYAFAVKSLLKVWITILLTSSALYLVLKLLQG